MPTITTKSGVTRTTLGAREKFKLTQLIMTKYKALGLDDIEFAKHAEEELKVPVTAFHVRYIRGEFDVPSNYSRTVGSSKTRVAQLEERVNLLEAQVATLLRERGNGHH